MHHSGGVWVSRQHRTHIAESHVLHSVEILLRVEQSCGCTGITAFLRNLAASPIKVVVVVVVATALLSQHRRCIWLSNCSEFSHVGRWCRNSSSRSSSRTWISLRSQGPHVSPLHDVLGPSHKLRLATASVRALEGFM